MPIIWFRQLLGSLFVSICFQVLGFKRSWFRVWDLGNGNCWSVREGCHCGSWVGFRADGILLRMIVVRNVVVCLFYGHRPWRTGYELNFRPF